MYNSINKDHPFIFAVDHKVEHLNDDFKESDHSIRDLFSIAQQGKCDALMTHLGLIEQYGPEFPDLTYIVKLNGKTNLIPRNERDPISTALWTIDQIVQFQNNLVSLFVEFLHDLSWQ